MMIAYTPGTGRGFLYRGDIDIMTLPIEPTDLSFHILGAHGSSALAALTNLTTGQPAGSRKLLIQALGNNARYTLDNTAPTAARGFQLRAGDPPVMIPVSDTTIIRIINEGAGCTLEYQWGV